MTRLSKGRPRHPRRHLPEPIFYCIHCGLPVTEAAPGTRHRNHCPHCLYSRHLDLRPGDRACRCGGPMGPIALWLRGGEELALIHRCERCGTLVSNRIAGDDDPATMRALLAETLEHTHAAPREGGCHDRP